MATKKIILNELRSLVKQIINEEQDWTQYQEKQNQLKYDNMNGDENVESITLFPFTTEFHNLKIGVLKTKDDLKDVAGATFGGASEDYYRRIAIALDDFYKNTYKPIEDRYVEDMKKEDLAKRRLYPQNSEK